MAKESRTILIEAPVEEVFGFAKDVGRLWALWPDVAVRDVRLTPDGVTRLTLECEWHETMPLIGGLLEGWEAKRTSKDLDKALANMKTQIEEG